ncbi:MarR family winged helix-turn-helix transcriptional regulator [Paenibacillus sp. GP183]|uniref:MarR family winged helix-turn-helix transcriptional regulator n=1 Tax=Paenibacillus sp. GP183 TaxID=1882751 RepID=UPI0008953F38|nr:MarR family winged helix-turn-helix transcriptional regulator [Paenibacillus sp. GP183]SEB93780.1 DNA-binding transcriptional regulator, MarR family [Paenibacillus sp. GP183]
MENPRELFQIMTRRLGLLDKNCCSTGGTDLTAIQSHILYEIDQQHNPSIQQIAETLSIDITTFSRQVQSLVNADLVKKTPFTEDRRVTILSLTTQGKYAATVVDQQMNEYLQDIFSNMTQFEQDMVIQSIKLLNASMAKSKMCCTPMG